MDTEMAWMIVQQEQYVKQNNKFTRSEYTIYNPSLF